MKSKKRASDTSASSGQHAGNLVWLDLEMTGLDPTTDEILEMAIVITDKSLEILEESKIWVFACEESILQGMDKWNTSTHGKSGLLDEVRRSKLDYRTGENEALQLIGKWVAEGQSPLCGNTICQDRRFLFRHMRRLHDYFHYRNFDVTTFKLAAMFWHSGVANSADKSSQHRALSDIKESIEEMRTYKKFLY